MRRAALFSGAMLVAGFAAPLSAQPNFDEVEIRAEQIAPGIAVLFGLGGNIGVSYGEDGTVMIDDQFAPLTEKIQAAVAELGADPASFLINTHWHFDHAGGNENFGEAGALIFAHENVRARLVSGGTVLGNQTAPAPGAALPVVTYDKGVSFHLNGDRVNVMFVGGGHTDGDSVVHWVEADVVHMGDLYINIGGYPFIDLESGGNVLNVMKSLDAVIAMTDDDTKIIPGHGPMSDKASLVAYRAMIGRAVDLVRELREEGKSREDAIAARPLRDFDRGDGFIGPDQFVGAIYDSLEAAES